MGRRLAKSTEDSWDGHVWMPNAGCLSFTLPRGRGAGLQRLMALQGRIWFGMSSNVEQKASEIDWQHRIWSPDFREMGEVW